MLPKRRPPAELPPSPSGHSNTRSILRPMPRRDPAGTGSGPKSLLQTTPIENSGISTSAASRQEAPLAARTLDTEVTRLFNARVEEVQPPLGLASGSDQRSNNAVDDTSASAQGSESAKVDISANQKRANFEDPGEYVASNTTLENIGTPEEIADKLTRVGYQCLPFVATQIALILNTPASRTRSLLLEGPSGCGKSFMAKSLAKITGAELMCLSCYKGMPTQNLIEYPSTLAMVSALSGKKESDDPESMLHLGLLSRAFLRSQKQPVILLIDELDKPDGAIDTFFLGPIQDGRIWLESRAPIDANLSNLLLIFTKNFNRVLDDALLRRVHPIKMTYLDSALERKILSPHCHPQLVANLVTVADRMRNSGGSYQFERPPAPEELLTAGQYITRLLDWGTTDFGFIGRSVWAIISKSEHDRAVLEHMLRYHPDFMDPLFPDGKNAALDEIHRRLGRILLNGIISDPDHRRREDAWKDMENF